jgi:flagellar motility protein MotE (MotC chaperone)
MKSVRLLPIVIFAAVALLTFKGVGLFTNGGYVLVGPSAVEAAGNASHPGTTSAEADAMGAVIEPTMTDTDPTATDSAPTLPLGPEAEAGHGAAEPAAGHGEAPAEGEGAGQESEVPVTETPADGAHGAAAPVAANPACPPVDAVITAEGEVEEPPEDITCDPSLMTADGDGVPMVQDENGQLVPFSPDAGSEGEVLERLGDRRAELDALEKELDMRAALVEAAEKRISERTALLEQLEARINALVDQNKSAEEEQFRSIIAMYETMKPKEAAAIFDELDMHTLLRVAKAMSPRKMAPIMAKMAPVKARDLTASMAITPADPTVEVTSEDLAALPQIVGQ